MKIKREEKDGVVVLRLDGKLMGGPDADTMKAHIQQAIDEGNPRVLIDLANVPWMNSTGLGILIANYTTLTRAEGKMKLMNVSSRINSVLIITQVGTVFETFSDEKSALASFS